MKANSPSGQRHGRALFEESLYARNWQGAAAILEGLPREETAEERGRLVRARAVLAARTREEQPLLAERWRRLADEVHGKE